MIGKSLFFLALFFGSLFGLSASAVTTFKNVDIIVTHGAALTTFTFVNNTGRALPAGTPVSMGQAFRYGDIMPGNYPAIRDATTHIALPGQQWDEISTWRENGGNGSWRHAVWAIWLPNSLAAGATYRIEMVPVSGVHSESSHQALSALCSGPAAHDFKIHLADVRNQDDTARDGGDATFRVCDNISNTGRDAPRHLRAGNVYDEYQVSGLFTYAASGHQDPMLYAQCVLDLFTDAADGTSLKDIRHVCTVHNSWENVAAGSVGNPGAPGPAGFPNDPQVLSYQPQILDGSTDILDWSNLSQTVSSAANPIQRGNCSNTWQGSLTLTVPGSTGLNKWWAGMPVRVSTTGKAVGGLTPGQLYWVYNCSSTVTSGADATIVNLMNTPELAKQVALPLILSQGSGKTTFTYVMWHPHWQSWQDEDASADPNWATRGSTTRFTRRIYPAFTNAEKTYWEETGLVLPVNLNQTPTVQLAWSNELTDLYNPFSKGNVIGTTGAGARPDIGFINEFAVQAFIDGTEYNWFLSRLYTMGAQTHGASTLLDESTGRIPVLNDGPPTGPGGNGVGGSYGTGTNASVALGVPQNQTSWSANYFHGITQPLQNVPNSLVSWECGIWLGCGTNISHIPNFVSLSYLIFGERLYLNSTYYDPNRDLLQRPPGVGDSYRDDIQGGNHYWGLTIACCQTRGSAWALRDRTFAAALGGDGNIERTYFNDQITENGNYYTQWLAYKNGPGNTEINTSILPPDFVGSWSIPDTFIGNYVFLATYGMQTFLHAPLAAQWLPPFQRFYEGLCGEQMGGHPSAYYCIDYTYSPAMHDGDHTTTGGNIGAFVNGTDASDFGNLTPETNILTGGQLQIAGGPYYTLAVGDKVRLVNGTYYGGTQLIDQLLGNTWFTVIGPIDNTAGTYYIQCPVHHAVDASCPTPGAAFKDFTRAGTSIAGETQELIIYRASYDPGTGYARFTYVPYGGEVMHGLKILGQDVSNALSIFAARGGESSYNSSYPSQWWDTSIVVP